MFARLADQRLLFATHAVQHGPRLRLVDDASGAFVRVDGDVDRDALVNRDHTVVLRLDGIHVDKCLPVIIFEQARQFRVDHGALRFVNADDEGHQAVSEPAVDWSDADQAAPRHTLEQVARRFRIAAQACGDLRGCFFGHAELGGECRFFGRIEFLQQPDFRAIRCGRETVRQAVQSLRELVIGCLLVHKVSFRHDLIGSSGRTIASATSPIVSTATSGEW